MRLRVLMRPLHVEGAQHLGPSMATNITHRIQDGVKKLRGLGSSGIPILNSNELARRLGVTRGCIAQLFAMTVKSSTHVPAICRMLDIAMPDGTSLHGMKGTGSTDEAIDDLVAFLQLWRRLTPANRIRAAERIDALLDEQGWT